MNEHAGWDKFGRCVLCLNKDSSSACLDPSSDEFRAYIINLEHQLRVAKDDAEFWQKKHKEDCLTMRQIGRKEGAQEMKKLIQELVWTMRFGDDELDAEISAVELKKESL